LPDFAVLRAMLFYIDEFPEKIHHTKESELLFPKIRARSAEGAEVLDRLDADHERSAIRVRELEHELLGFEMMTDAPDASARRAAFEKGMGALHRRLPRAHPHRGKDRAAARRAGAHGGRLGRARCRVHAKSRSADARPR
jgi:hypothetical protein